MKATIVTRARILCGLFSAVALLLCVRLYFVQVVHGDEYAKSASAQYVATSVHAEDRGTIFFTTKDGTLVSAAVTQTGFTIAIDPGTVSDASSTYARLNALTPIDHDSFFASAAKKNDPYEEVAHHLNEATANSVRSAKIPGVIIASDSWRDYPGTNLGAQAVGFIGYTGTSTSRVGEYGLEKKYDSTLAQNQDNLYVNPFAEIFSNMQDLVAQNPADSHGSIVTSIEPNVQAQLEKTLQGVMSTYSTQFAGGIIMDPHTGAIYAIGGLPSYDPNNYGAAASPDNYVDKLIEGRYELGSIMKPLTMAAGIDSGSVSESSTYDDTGCITVSTYKVCNFDLKARGVIPMQQILSQSLNVGASYVATKTGYPVFTNYMRAYGFGSKTGVDLPNEVTGDLSPLGNGTGPAVNYDTASFGQGISVSPIEMIRALSTLANDGKLPYPHVVTAIKYESGISRSITFPNQTQAIKPETALMVTNMLTKVFDESLLKGALKQTHYSFAAKTGTAQIPMPGGGYYPGNVYLHSFFGYFPAHDPKFIIFLFAWKPQGQEYASATLAHPFMDIAQFLINYYNIPPDR